MFFNLEKSVLEDPSLEATYRDGSGAFFEAAICVHVQYNVSGYAFLFQTTHKRLVQSSSQVAYFVTEVVFRHTFTFEVAISFFILRYVNNFTLLVFAYFSWQLSSHPCFAAKPLLGELRVLELYHIAT